MTIADRMGFVVVFNTLHVGRYKKRAYIFCSTQEFL